MPVLLRKSGRDGLTCCLSGRRRSSLANEALAVPATEPLTVQRQDLRSEKGFEHQDTRKSFDSPQIAVNRPKLRDDSHAGPTGPEPRTRPLFPTQTDTYLCADRRHQW